MDVGNIEEAALQLLGKEVRQLVEGDPVLFAQCGSGSRARAIPRVAESRVPRRSIESDRSGGFSGTIAMVSILLARDGCGGRVTVLTSWVTRPCLFYLAVLWLGNRTPPFSHCSAFCYNGGVPGDTGTPLPPWARLPHLGHGGGPQLRTYIVFLIRANKMIHSNTKSSRQALGNIDRHPASGPGA